MEKSDCLLNLEPIEPEPNEKMAPEIYVEFMKCRFYFLPESSFTLQIEMTQYEGSIFIF